MKTTLSPKVKYFYLHGNFDFQKFIDDAIYFWNNMQRTKKCDNNSKFFYEDFHFL